MTIRRTFLGLLLLVLLFGVPLFAAGSGNAEPGAVLTSAISRLDHEASNNNETPVVFVYLLRKEFGTGEAELKWALDQKLNWGQITALSFIQATTGRSFAEMSRDNAPRDFWSYAENAGMNSTKMARSLDGFLKRVERERNSRIFDSLRASRRVHALPDLGNGFGLFQEALDFRRIDSPRGPTKVHEIPGELGKGTK
ncbi:MAG: hypothetical protein DMG16_12935 [Acidobacteria bacterium]|nr:MAG: hypothetical protein DMG16_12935 [Acidobacteriota bacterium]